MSARCAGEGCCAYILLYRDHTLWLSTDWMHISIDQMNEIYTVQDFYNLSEVFSLHQGTVEDT